MLAGACGGGGSVAEPEVNLAPFAQAGPAQDALAGALVTLDGSASSDPEGDPLAYSWRLAAQPAGSLATLSAPASVRPTFVPDVAGVYVIDLSVADGRSTSSDSRTIVTVRPASTVEIVLDRGVPLEGRVQLSLSQPLGGATVRWYVDLSLVGEGPTLSLDTTGLSNATHLLLARVELASGTFAEVRKAVDVSNVDINVSGAVSGTTATITVGVQASSPSGIVSVAAALDGHAIGTLTLPNYCYGACGGLLDVYAFMIDAYAARSGDHTVMFTVTNGSGEWRQITLDVPISNAPVITLTSPADGAVVSGSLRLAGSYTTDKPYPVTVTATLGSVMFLETTDANFAADYDLTGLPPRTYQLVVRASNGTNVAEVRRSVVVN